MEDHGFTASSLKSRQPLCAADLVPELLFSADKSLNVIFISGDRK